MFYNKKIFKRFFTHRGKKFWKNFKEIPGYCRSMRFLIKHGYDEYATWGTDSWFIDVMKEILTHYRNDRTGTVNILGSDDFDDWDSDEYWEENSEKWNETLDRMIDLLDKMDEKYYSEEYKKSGPEQCEKAKNRAKDEFFRLFSEHFYDFWD